MHEPGQTTAVPACLLLNPGQMKMALTRPGFGAKMVVAGDSAQSDPPPQQPCGRHHAIQVLRDTEGVAFCELTQHDIVRHHLVQRIVAACESRSQESGRANEEAQ